MIRFAIYAILLASSVVGMGLIFANRRTLTPRLMALAAPMSLTLAWSVFMVTKTVLFWASGHWWQEPPVSPTLAAMLNSLVLAWVSTGLVDLVDRIWQSNGQ